MCPGNCHTISPSWVCPLLIPYDLPLSGISSHVGKPYLEVSQYRMHLGILAGTSGRTRSGKAPRTLGFA